MPGAYPVKNDALLASPILIALKLKHGWARATRDLILRVQNSTRILSPIRATGSCTLVAIQANMGSSDGASKMAPALDPARPLDQYTVRKM